MGKTLSHVRIDWTRINAHHQRIVSTKVSRAVVLGSTNGRQLFRCRIGSSSWEIDQICDRSHNDFTSIIVLAFFEVVGKALNDSKRSDRGKLHLLGSYLRRLPLSGE